MKLEAYLYAKKIGTLHATSLHSTTNTKNVYFLSIACQTYQIYANIKGISKETTDMVFRVNKLELLFAIVNELCISANEG